MIWAQSSTRLDVELPPDMHGVGVVHPKEGGVSLEDRDGVVLRKILNLRPDGQTEGLPEEERGDNSEGVKTGRIPKFSAFLPQMLGRVFVLIGAPRMGSTV